MRNEAVTPEGRDYPIRNCPYCMDEIPRITKNGNFLWASKYKQIKTCGKSECIGLSQASTRPKAKIQIPNDMMNRFILGR